MSFKIRDEDIPEIIRLYDVEQYELGQLAAKYRVSSYTIRTILLRNGFVFGSYKRKKGTVATCIGVVRDGDGNKVEEYHKRGGA